MPLGADTAVTFRKNGQPDLLAFVRIVPMSSKGQPEGHSIEAEYVVYWDDQLLFADGSRIGQGCFIVWSELPMPATLNTPKRYSQPWPRASASFKNEAL